MARSLLLERSRLADFPASARDRRQLAGVVIMAAIKYADCTCAIIDALRSAGASLTDKQRSLLMPTVAPFLEDAYKQGQESERIIFNDLLP